ncbi:MAG: (d)CMP kinase [Peptoniphilaceae bacterium]|nr:(d)CMP kinase [Peptoniphilaceae bacterium]MDD7383031.1 (d)CMP kinase [Peptoniphilaceae bacterium]MDY3737782.1 (d)CMP kinase [Peptoniphilaceae bacterium]
MKDKYIIALDGPSGAGKSTISKLISQKLNIEYLDTGAMYRAVTKYFLDNNIELENDDEIKNTLDKIKITFESGDIYLNNENISDEIRTEEINSNVSFISSLKSIREFLVNEQRNISKNKSIILDGRDIGTVVFPNADYKFFLTASSDVRAKRRYDQDITNETFEEIKSSIEKRDYFDSHREISPLKRACDAILIDSSNLTIEQTVNEIINVIKG